MYGQACSLLCIFLHLTSLGLLIGSEFYLDKKLSDGAQHSARWGTQCSLGLLCANVLLILNAGRKAESYNSGYLTLPSAFSLHAKQRYCIKDLHLPLPSSSSVGCWYTSAVNSLSPYSLPLDKADLCFSFSSQCFAMVSLFFFFFEVSVSSTACQ